MFHYKNQELIHQTSDNKMHHMHNIPSLDFSEDGRFLFSASIDGSCKVWDLKNFPMKISLFMDSGQRRIHEPSEW